MKHNSTHSGMFHHFHGLKHLPAQGSVTGIDLRDMLVWPSSHYTLLGAHQYKEKFKNDSPFEFSMNAVAAAQSGLLACLENQTIFDLKAEKQDNSMEIRYSRHKDFTDGVVKEYTDRVEELTSEQIIRLTPLNPVAEW